MKEKKLIVAKSIKWYSAYPLYIICIPIHCSWNDKAPVPPKRILQVDLFNQLRFLRIACATDETKLR